MNILVTGGAGFIGSQIVDAYIKKNHHVIIVDNLSKGQKEFINPKATFHELSISSPLIGQIIKTNNIEIINHHAAQISVTDSVQDPVKDAESNIIGTLQLLQSAVKFGVKKIIFASTGGAIYGEQDYFPAKENHPQKPTSPYGISKLSIENYLRFYQEQYGIKSIIFRYGNVFGPRQNPNGEAGVVAIFCNRLLKSQVPIINGNGEQTRDYVFIKDVVQANVLALNTEIASTYNVGTSKETSVNEITKLLIQIAKSNISPEKIKRNNYEQLRSCLDYKKLEGSLGWKPMISVEKGLIETYNYFKNN